MTGITCRRRGRLSAAALTVAMAAVVAACGSGGSATPPAESGLVGVSWRLSSSLGEITTADTDPSAVDMPQIGFEANGDMGAYDGCNYRSGTFSVSEDRITFGSSGASTTKACENDPVSAAFDAVLSEHSTFKIEAQELTLTAPNGATLIFEADS